MICYMATFGEWLHDELAAKNIKPIELARRARVDPGSLTRMLKGERNPNPETLASIAEALKVSYETIFRAATGRPLKEPKEQKPDRDFEEMKYIYDDLSPDGKDDLIDYARGRLKRYGRTKRDMG